jgi:nitrogen fixation/metabolism regulation signal transduction histidine kinase
MKNALLKNFHLNVILRLITVTLTIAITCFLYVSLSEFSIIIAGCLLSIWQVHLLFRYINHINKELTRFLMAIKYSDYSQTFNRHNLGGTFDALGEAFEQVILKFQETKRKEEEHYKYLITVTQHIGVGLISFNQQGKIELLNNAAKKILKVTSLSNINDLPESRKELAETFRTLKRNGKKLIKINNDKDMSQLFMYATEFKLQDHFYKLVAFQNIQNELEEKEMEAWQKLIRVLTHEIMNSVTPISSLSATVAKILDETRAGNKELDSETINDLAEALNTIHKRSDGLINFVDKYRDLTRIPKPNFNILTIDKLFGRIKQLMENELLERKIDFTISITPPSLEFTADSQMIEQILINLLMNSMHALAGNETPRIELRARLDDQCRVLIDVEDNGVGIEKEVQDKIFIPFFTTKKEGSGIGLSLSRQIMRIHGGTINVSSTPGLSTIFTLRF